MRFLTPNIQQQITYASSGRRAANNKQYASGREPASNISVMPNVDVVSDDCEELFTVLPCTTVKHNCQARPRAPPLAPDQVLIRLQTLQATPDRLHATPRRPPQMHLL